MPDEVIQPTVPSPERPKNVVLLRGMLGVVGCASAIYSARAWQWNLITYAVQRVPTPAYTGATVFASALLALLVLGAGLAVRRDASFSKLCAALGVLWPLVACMPLAVTTTFMDTVPFAVSLLAIFSCAVTAARVAARLSCGEASRRGHALAIGLLAGFIALATVVHTLLQLNFFEHFMLGHADFGHFTEELKNAWLGRGLRSDSFTNTRLGWHFVPFLYALVPGYAVWPSPVYLMAVGAFVVHFAALPVYITARHLSGSTLVGWLFGAAWLLLPSQSRLVYSNTYGFQWIYITLPILVAMIGTGLSGRWRWSIALAVVVLLCKETAAAATFGWGVYMVFYSPRRKAGAALAACSVAYAMLCIHVIIPHFAASGAYERLTLFGELGGSFSALAQSALSQPGAFFGRLFRSQGIWFLLTLLVPMALAPLAKARLLVAALPSLGLVFLLQNPDYLSLKFWHYATVLPFLFMGAVAAIKRTSGAAPVRSRLLCFVVGCDLKPSASNLGLAAAVFMAAAWGHYFFGFSPIAKSYEMYAGAAVLHTPDPRLATVQTLRERFGKQHTVLATERLAAHFTDYRRLYTGSRQEPTDLILIDESDRWDKTGLPQSAPRFLNDARYTFYGAFGSIVVFTRVPDAHERPLRQN